MLKWMLPCKPLLPSKQDSKKNQQISAKHFLANDATMNNASKRINDFKTSLISATTSSIPQNAPQSRKRASSPDRGSQVEDEDDNGKQDDEEMIIIAQQRPQSVLDQFNKKAPPVQNVWFVLFSHLGVARLIQIAKCCCIIKYFYQKGQR